MVSPKSCVGRASDTECRITGITNAYGNGGILGMKDLGSPQQGDPDTDSFVHAFYLLIAVVDTLGGALNVPGARPGRHDVDSQHLPKRPAVDLADEALQMGPATPGGLRKRQQQLPKLKAGVFHPYRRLWATERKSLPDVDVAAAGGWKDTQALRLSYQRADPVGILKVVQGG